MKEFDNLREANREIARLRDFIKTRYSLIDVNFNLILNDLLELGCTPVYIRDKTGIGHENIKNFQNAKVDTVNPRHCSGEKLIALWAKKTGNCIFEAPKK